MLDKIIECVPNFSNGQSKEIVDSIANEIKSIDKVKLLDVDHIAINQNPRANLYKKISYSIINRSY